MGNEVGLREGCRVVGDLSVDVVVAVAAVAADVAVPHVPAMGRSEKGPGEGACVGAGVGVCVGVCVGLLVGERVGAAVGAVQPFGEPASEL